MRIWVAGGMALLVAVAGAALASNGVAASIFTPPPLHVSGSVSPAKLPPTRRVPVTLQMGFQAYPIEGQVPELDEIWFGVTRRFNFAAESWPQSCSLAKLYSPRVDPRRACAGSLIGHGRVGSEITVPGQAPVKVTGHLLAFYARGNGQPRILAQVTTGEPLPLVYVIPFTIRTVDGNTKMSVPRRRMRAIRGKCRRGHPNCFAPSPYTLEGVYSHISEMSISLHRVLGRGSRPISFVNSHGCTLPDFPVDENPALGVGLVYAEGGHQSGVVFIPCKARGR